MFKRFHPFRAVRDLRAFLSRRKPSEVVFLALSLAVTWVILFMFVHDTHVEAPYKRNIIYAESWPLTRTDEEIRAQQVIDQAKKSIAEAELEKRRKKRQQEFKKIDDGLKKWGI